MNRSARIIVFAALLPACADSCGCGEQAARQKSPAHKSATAAPSAAGGGPELAVGEEHYSDEAEAMRRKLAPMPESDERRALEAAAKAIDVSGDLGDPLDAKLLAKALPDDVDDYDAAGAAATGTTPAELGSATVATRKYKDGKALINLKITDTADAPALRRDLVAQLTSIGNEPTGSQTGVLSDGVPGVRAYHEEHKVSRASALIAGRFLVEALADNAVEQDDAWTAIEEVERSDLERAAAAAAALRKKK